MTNTKNTIDHADLANVTGGAWGQPIDWNAAQQCMTDTSRAWTPIGAAAGAAASVVATRGVGIDAAMRTGGAIGGGLGAGVGWLGSVLGQFFGGNPCPTAPASR
jgi:hypothetical protein